MPQLRELIEIARRRLIPPPSDEGGTELPLLPLQLITGPQCWHFLIQLDTVDVVPAKSYKLSLFAANHDSTDPITRDYSSFIAPSPPGHGGQPKVTFLVDKLDFPTIGTWNVVMRVCNPDAEETLEYIESVRDIKTGRKTEPLLQ
jgi:hypothetical protein